MRDEDRVKLDEGLTGCGVKRGCARCDMERGWVKCVEREIKGRGGEGRAKYNGEKEDEANDRIKRVM